MFRNRFLMGVAIGPGTRLLRQTTELAIFLLIFTQNVPHISCSSKVIDSKVGDGYASWAATQATGVFSNPFTVKPATADVDTHRLKKRMDLELCLGKYEIHKNTIIRTGESQTLGGKYLQGLELDTTEECQRLCCETESCDVYVFEDKSDGYCYLFECGPPENFHCKFTRHTNYTSAVLTVAHNLNEKTTKAPSATEMAGTKNFSQQEWELTRLKVKPETHDKMTSGAVGSGKVPADISTVYMVGMPVTATSRGNTNILATAAPEPMLGADRIPPMSLAFPQNVYPPHCGRFQFPCHSGECIAVYNACDGIPQCEDGSDEGPECSGATSTAKSEGDTASAINVETKGQKFASVPQYQSPPLQDVAKSQLISMSQLHQRQQKQRQQIAQQNLSGVASPLINNREDAAAWETRKAVSPRPQEQAINDDMKNRIFSHKGGIQVPTTGVNANNSPNSVQTNSYANTDINNSPNINLNPAYNTVTLQRNGIYVPQITDFTTGDMYVPQQQQQQQIPPQQQYVVPVAMMPSNVQWQIQQSKQMVLTPQTHIPQQQQSLPLPLQPRPPYNINLGDQQQQADPVTAKEASEQSVRYVNAPAVVPSLQHKTELIDSQQQSVVPVTLPNGSLVVSKSVSGESNTIQTAASNVKVKEQNIEYEEEEMSTYPPKKKQKYLKMTNLPKSEKVKSQLDPIELTLEEQRQRVIVPSPVHEQYKLIHDNLGFEFRDHDGQSERPGGAMLSLTLGLLVTAALAILIGCRMRTVGRRTRRMGGKAPYSHEADFLVNGMYL
uniref:Low-density lipoprotein receptor-related protein 11 n=1 Tax=Bactrocera dorsalis TaxID=27457 RepID=A0A034WDU0_BACDO